MDVKWGKKEWEAISFLFGNNKMGIEVLDERFEYCLKWYISHACKLKFIFYCTTFSGAVCPLLAAIINTVSPHIHNNGLIWPLGIISAFSGISVIILNATRAQEKWTRYRDAAEFLKRQRTDFQYERGNLSAEDDIYNLGKKYLNIIENYMEEENNKWKINNVKLSGSDEAS